jgi:hypothetical protein
MLLAVVAREHQELRQFDIRTAFLNVLSEEEYIHATAGAVGLAGGGDRGLQLKKGPEQFVPIA